MYRLPSLRDRIRAIKCALGYERPDIVLRNCKLTNVFTGEIEDVDIAVCGRLISRVGECSDLVSKAKKVIDLDGKYVCPGLIDAHVHIESSMVTPSIFSKYALVHGVTTVFADPHEIGNVLGFEGIREFMKECYKCPIKTFLTVPSCIPATKLKLETNPNVLTIEDIEKLLNEEESIALGEVMDVGSVLNIDLDILKEIELAYTTRYRVCGHAPKLRGKELCAYISSGPDSDHEITDPDEAMEKVRRGMYIMIRYGTFSKDLENIIEKLPKNALCRTMIVSDDINIVELRHRYLDKAITLAIRKGVDVVDAVRMCTLVPAQYYGLDWALGCIAPGRLADIVILEDLYNFKIKKIICEGDIVYSNGELMLEFPHHIYPPHFKRTVKIPKISPEDLVLRFKRKFRECKISVIEFIKGSVLTKWRIEKFSIEDGKLVLPEGYYYITVIERHGKSGSIGRGICTGINLRDFSIGITISHDSHNLTVVGRDEKDMYAVVSEIERIGGGLVIAKNGQIIEEVPLEIAGLMSSDENVITRLERLLRTISSEVLDGLIEIAPLMFASLVVIPEIRITDRGLVDVSNMKIIDPVVEIY